MEVSVLMHCPLLHASFLPSESNLYVMSCSLIVNLRTGRFYFGLFMNKFMQTDHSVVQSRSKDKNNTGEEPSLD